MTAVTDLATSHLVTAAALPPPDHLPVPLRPMTIPDILDGAFAVVRTRPRLVMAASACVQVPVQLLAAYAQRLTYGSVSADILFSDPWMALGASDSGNGASGGLVVLAWVLGALSLSILAAVVSILMAAWYRGTDETVGGVVRGVLRCLPATLTAWVLVHAIEGVALFSGFGSIIFMTLFMVTGPVIATERVGPIRGMRRSWNLVSGRFWPVLGVAFLGAIVTSVLTNVVVSVPTFALAWGGNEESVWVAVGVARALASLVTVPVVAAATCLVYLDLRVRREGLDLELDARRVLDVA